MQTLNVYSFRWKSILIGLLAFISILTINAGSAIAVEVGVIIDTSKSMRKSDREQYAVLATKILVDILDPSEDDLFVVFFNNRYPSAKDISPHKLIRWSPLKYTSKPGDYTSAFHRELTQHSKYNANCTYFAPSLRFALKSFTGQYGPKLLIFLTDGESNDILKDRGCATSNGRYEQDRFDGEINKLILKEKVKVAPLLLSKGLKKRVRANLLQSYFLTFFDQSGRGGEPLQEVKKAVDLPCKFAELISKTTTREVQCLGKLSKQPRRVKRWQSAGGLGFDVDPAMSRADVISVVGGGFLTGPQSRGKQDIHLIQPQGHPPSWKPLKGDFSLGRHLSRYTRGKSKNSSYSVLRVKGAGPGQSPHQGHWNIYRDRSTKLTPYSFVVKYYDFAVSLNTQSQRRSIPLNQPICFEALLTDRNAKNPTPLPASVLRSVEVQFFSKFQKLVGLPPTPIGATSTTADKPLRVLERLLDDGFGPDQTADDASANGCVTLTAQDLGLTPQEVKKQEVIGLLKAKVAVSYNGDPRLQSKEIVIKILPPMELTPEDSGVVQIYGDESQGLGIDDQRCEPFLFSEANSHIPKIDKKRYNRFKVRVRGLAKQYKNSVAQSQPSSQAVPTTKPQVATKPQLIADPIFDKMKVSLCVPENPGERLCKQSPPSTAKTKLRFPDIPVTVYSEPEKTSEAIVDLTLDQEYLVCISAKFRYNKVESPDPAGPHPIRLVFTPDDQDYRDAHPEPPLPAKPTYAPNGPKWSIEGGVKLHIRLRAPSFWEKFWSSGVLLSLILLYSGYVYHRRRNLKLPKGLKYRIWDELSAMHSGDLLKVPAKKKFEIKRLGLELSTGQLDLSTGEGIIIKIRPATVIGQRDRFGGIRPMTFDEHYKAQINVDTVYCRQLDGKPNLYFMFTYERT